MLSNVKSRTLLAKSPKTPVAFNDPYKKGILFIPMIISGGFLYSTSNGLTDLNNFDTNDFTWMEIIADGQGDLQVCWDGSTSIQTNKETIQNEAIGIEQELTTNATITYQVGKYGWGFSSDLNSSFDIKQDASYNDFNVMFQSEEVSLIVKSEDCVGIDFKKFRFYCLPEVGKKKIFYISSLVEHRDINDSKKVISYDITFTHITNKLQKSGKAIEEYFHFSSPGMGYAWPNVDRENKQILLDEEALTTTGINLVQEEEYNAAIHNNTAFIGWELKEDEEECFVGEIRKPKKLEDGTWEQVFYKPTQLFPHNFESGEASILNRRALPESDILFIEGIDFSEDAYTTWTDYWTQLFSNDFSVKYSGECAYRSSKQLGSIDKLNDNLDISQTYNQSGINNPYVKQNFGSVSYSQLNWADVNMLNYYCCSDIYTLPFSFTYHILNQPKQWPIIGGIVNFFTGGYSYGWDEQYRRILNKNSEGVITYLKNITGITSYSMVEIAQKNWKKKGSGDNKFFINDFYKKDSDDRFNANNRSLILKYQLTKDLDTSDKLLVAKDMMTSSWLGQDYVYVGNKDEEGNKIIEQALANGEHLQLSSTWKLRRDNNLRRKFIVCGISNQTCFAESQKYIFYNYNQPKWVGAFLTNSNFRDNSRDWNNWYTINPLNNLPFSGKQINYPLDLSQKGEIGDELIIFAGNQPFATKEWTKNKVDFVAYVKDVSISTVYLLKNQLTFTSNYTFNDTEITSTEELANLLVDRLKNQGLQFTYMNELTYCYKLFKSYGISEDYTYKPDPNRSSIPNNTNVIFKFPNATFDKETNIISLGDSQRYEYDIMTNGLTLNGGSTYKKYIQIMGEYNIPFFGNIFSNIEIKNLQIIDKTVKLIFNFGIIENLVGGPYDVKNSDGSYMVAAQGPTIGTITKMAKAVATIQDRPQLLYLSLLK